MEIRIVAKRDGFRRCGVAHPTVPTFHPRDRFTDEQVAQLQQDPMLVVDLFAARPEAAAPIAPLPVAGAAAPIVGAPIVEDAPPPPTAEATAVPDAPVAVVDAPAPTSATGARAKARA